MILSNQEEAMLMKDVLMIIHTMGSLDPSDNDRFTYLAKKIIETGEASVEIVTSDFEHHKKKYRDEDVANCYPFKFIFLHESAYMKNVSVRRIKGHNCFANNLKKYLDVRNKPDVIYCAVPPIGSAKVAAQYAEKNHIKFVIDIQDLWPESFQIVLGNNKFSKLLVKPMMKEINYVYSRADVITAVSDTFVRRAKKVNYKAIKTESVYLGTDSELIARVLLEKDDILKPENEFWIGYVGNIAASYDFKNLFKALSIVKAQGINNIHFQLMGDGDLREEVEALSKEFFPNTNFYGYLPYEKMFRYLKQCDIAVNPIVKGSVSSVINKVGDYAAAGVPVVSSQDSPEYIALLNKYNAGITALPEDADSIAHAIVTLYKDSQMRKELGENNHKLFEDKFDRLNTYRKIVESLIK